MGPLFTWFDRRVAPPLRRFGEAIPMVAIREALPVSFAGLIAGGLGFVWFVPAATVAARVFPALLAGFAVMSALLVMLLAYRLARAYAISPALVLLLAAALFALSLPQPFGRSALDLATRLGPSGLLLAIAVALAAAGIPAYARARAGPAGAIVAAALLLALAALLFAQQLSLAAAIAALMRPLGLLGDSAFAFVAIVAIETLLWTAGIHGPALLAGVITPIYLALQFENTHASALHAPLPHVVTTSLFLFVFPGGAGATLPLVLLLLRSRVPRLRKLGYAVLVPAIFNMNEPLLFGLPLVMNPILAVPFVTVPLLLAFITYAAVALHAVNRTILYIPGAVPSPVAAFAATGDWRAVALLAVNVAVAAIVYWPFLRAYERYVEAA